MKDMSMWAYFSALNSNVNKSPYSMDATILLVDTALVTYGLQTEEQIKNFKRKTLFDMPVKKITKRK